MDILNNVSLRKYNTFGIDVKALFFASITKPEQLQEVLNRKEVRSLPFLILGGGSNILFTENVEKLVLKVDIQGIKQELIDNEHILVTAGAGENWDSFVQYCVNQNWGGLENLSLIPGTVGASPIQNIGAYGTEVKDVFSHLEALDMSGFSIKRFTLPECRFGYRDSVFKNELKNRYLINSVSFLLSTQPKPNLSYPALKNELVNSGSDISIREVADTVSRIRRNKLPDPMQIGNAGSFFKNPVIYISQYNNLKERYPDLPSYPNGNDRVKLPAAWLIDKCGWKGRRIGDAGVHTKQALVLVNYGNASGKEIIELSQRIKESVFNRFNIHLDTEVNII